jgi:hypothetical protein
VPLNLPAVAISIRDYFLFFFKNKRLPNKCKLINQLIALNISHLVPQGALGSLLKYCCQSLGGNV